ncbi:MAG: secondary thiamine-phosphate synthase enzyme YjbQ [Candidatus Caldatribacteriaceae bacterium]
MYREISVKTRLREECISITALVQGVVKEEGVRDGWCVVYVPHTTAGVTIQENADPDVIEDLMAGLDRMVPHHVPYQHGEGNSPAHIKASLMGASVTVFIEEGRLLLGTWQGIFLCEFDGPRNRRVWVKVVGIK